ncbi:MAG: Fic family protein [Vicinamibacteria bacterium]|nr:Fic family protein [Vicinamibacteria bacterium]
MMTFRMLQGWDTPTSAVWLMTDIAESKGRTQLFAKQSPQILKVLLETALIQSAESSNRIEGVTVDPERLRPLVKGCARPRDRSEQEIQGYRRALDLIHAKWPRLSITPTTARQLHRLALNDAVDAGAWKKADNEIVELRPGESPLIRFLPVSAVDTPRAMDELCLSYRAANEQRHLPPLLAVAALVLDFLCIHPFRDGNGRVSRLLTLLALYQHGHDVGRYISTERLVEDAKEDYYGALGRSSQSWHESRHDFVPWLTYFLTIVRRAYRELEKRAGDVKAPRGAKTQLIEAAIDGFVADFTLGEIERQCPGVSRDMIRRVLRDLKNAGRLHCRGRGPGARWSRRGNTLKKG